MQLQHRICLCSPIMLVLLCTNSNNYVIAKEDNDRGNGVVALLEYEVSSPMLIKIAFENNTTKPIKYWFRADGRIGHFGISLYKDGKSLPRLWTELPPLLNPNELQQLLPGDFVVQSINLKDEFGKLSPGKYEVRVRYNIPKGSGPNLKGITAMQIEKTVFIIVIKKSIEN